MRWWMIHCWSLRTAPLTAPARLSSVRVDKFLDLLDDALSPLAPWQQELLVQQIWSEFIAAAAVLPPGRSLSVALEQVKDSRTMRDAQATKRQEAPPAAAAPFNGNGGAPNANPNKRDRWARGPRGGGRGSTEEAGGAGALNGKRGRGGKGRGKERRRRILDCGRRTFGGHGGDSRKRVSWCVAASCRPCLGAHPA